MDSPSFIPITQLPETNNDFKLPFPAKDQSNDGRVRYHIQ